MRHCVDCPAELPAEWPSYFCEPCRARLVANGELVEAETAGDDGDWDDADESADCLEDRLELAIKRADAE